MKHVEEIYVLTFFDDKQEIKTNLMAKNPTPLLICGHYQALLFVHYYLFM